MPGGRPTVYKPEYADAARSFCASGATNALLAEQFAVSRSTIDRWIAAIPDFRHAIQQGREAADGAVVSALFARHGHGAEDDQGLLPQRPADHGGLQGGAAA
jgi:hypothetical protein